jgi:hypothetical protein
MSHGSECALHFAVAFQISGLRLAPRSSFKKILTYSKSAVGCRFHFPLLSSRSKCARKHYKKTPVNANPALYQQSRPQQSLPCVSQIIPHLP